MQVVHRLNFRLSIIILLVAFSTLVYGQIEVSSLTSQPYEPEYLVTNVLVGDGVEVGNIQYAGNKEAGGLFSNGLGAIGLDEGIILSTGKVSDINTPHDLADVGFQFSQEIIDDVELATVSTGRFGDLVSYEFTFIPTSDTIQFQYVFASQEYPDFVCADFNDVFGFFVTGPDPAGGMYTAKNIALVPELADPSGLTFTDLPVAINTVNSGIPGTNIAGQEVCDLPGETLIYSDYFNDNQGNSNLKYGGYSDVFVAQAVVEPCQEYTIKIVLADVGDFTYDSAVFLESKSFTSSTLSIEKLTSTRDGNVAEGCDEMEIRISLPTAAETDTVIPYRIITNGIPGIPAQLAQDFNINQDSIRIAAGFFEARLLVEALEDGIDEDQEYIAIEVPISSCAVDTLIIGINDNVLDSAIKEDTIATCDDRPVVLELKDFFNASIQEYDSNTRVDLMDNGETLIPLSISDYSGTEITNETIFRICIDSLIHPDLTDIDMFVSSPSGQILELSTDNGNVNTGGPEDVSSYISTCFSIISNSDNINNGNAVAGDIFPGNLDYRGTYDPEGDKSILWSDRGPINGEWQLIIVDDTQGFTGYLTGWSIDLLPGYEIRSPQWTDESGQFISSSGEATVSPTVETKYFLQTSDTYGCSSTDSVVVIPSAPPDLDLFSYTITAPMSSCAADGSIQVTGPAGENWEYTFKEKTNETGLFEDLGNIEDTLFISDGFCINDTLLTIGNSTGLAIDFDRVRPLCNSDDDGSITATLIGSVGTPDYLWSTGATTQTISNLTAGEYWVEISDGGGCAKRDTFELTNQNTLEVVMDVRRGAADDPICFGSRDGLVGALTLLNGSDVTPQMQYEWNDPNMTSQFAIQNVFAGIYEVEVTDPSTGCSVKGTAEIFQKESLLTDSLAVDPNCFNTSDGSIDLTLNVASAADVSVLWSTGTSDPKIENLSSGMYSADLTNSTDQCTEEFMFTLVSPDTIKSNIQLDTVSCFGIEDGGIMVTAGGGIGGLQFIWTDNVTGPDRSGLAAGPYELTIQDNNNCRLVETYEVPGPLQITNNVDQKTDVQCHGESTGSLDMSYAGGVGSYTHSWTQVDGPFTSSAEDVFGLSAGNYAIETIDSLGCSEKDTFEIFENAEILIMEDITNVSCTGDGNGRIAISSEGGAGALEFLWTGPGTFSSTDESISDLDGGSYQLIVTDRLGCQASSTPYLVDEPLSAVDIVQITRDTICNAASDGILSASAIGGTGVLTYTWEGSVTGERIIDLPAGVYSLEVMDENGCTVREEIAVVEKDLLNVDFDLKPADCFEETSGTGSATIRTIDGTVGAIGNYTYLWNDANPPSEGISAENLVGSATYTVSITDDDGCVDIQEVFIPSPDPIMINEVELIQTSCSAGDDGSIEVSASGGSGGPYDYTWSGNTRFQVTEKAENLEQGFYSVTVSDQNGCESDADFAITDPAELVIVTTGFDASCFGDNDGQGQVTAIGGTPGYSILWSNGVTSDMNPDLVAGKYLVEVMDEKGCIVEDSIVINQPEEPIRIETNATGSDCGTDQAGRIDVLAAGGNGNYRYSLDNLVYSGSPSFLGLEPGSYVIFVRDEKGCIEQSSTVTVPESVSALAVDIGEDEKINFGSSITVAADVPTGNQPFIYSWRVDPEVPLSCTDCEVVTLTDLEVPVVLTLTVADATGCSTTASKRITLENFNFVDVPTGFTPDGNGSNDLLSVYGKKEVVIENFRVYSRWGQVVYEQRNFPVNDETIGWDGTFQGQAMSSDVYVWTIEAAFPNGEKAIYQGQTQLIR